MRRRMHRPKHKEQILLNSSTDKEFLLCGDPIPYTTGCVQPINVLYHDPSLLVLQSDYVDVIWKGVARAQKEGYQVDAMTSYPISGPAENSPNHVNLLVSMSIMAEVVEST